MVTESRKQKKPTHTANKNEQHQSSWKTFLMLYKAIHIRCVLLIFWNPTDGFIINGIAVNVNRIRQIKFKCIKLCEFERNAQIICIHVNSWVYDFPAALPLDWNWDWHSTKCSAHWMNKKKSIQKRKICVPHCTCLSSFNFFWSVCSWKEFSARKTSELLALECIAYLSLVFFIQSYHSKIYYVIDPKTLEA